MSVMQSGNYVNQLKTCFPLLALGCKTKKALAGTTTTSVATLSLIVFSVVNTSEENTTNS